MRWYDWAIYAFFTGVGVFTLWSLTHSIRGLWAAFKEMTDDPFT